MTSQGEDGKIQIRNSQHKGRIIKIFAVIAIIVLIGFTAKNHFNSDAAAKKANTPPQAPAVILYTVTAKDLSPSRSFVGKVEAIQSVSLKPQVSGEIKKVNFKEGSSV
ncbi:MAG: hypothetical protein PHO18_00785, partial [Synergistaceae bacterium]|nr:hypothetical protein [Synergistaceae bacterium]